MRQQRVTAYSNSWRNKNDHIKLSAILLLSTVLVWQLGIAGDNLNRILTTYAKNKEALITPVSQLKEILPEKNKPSLLSESTTVIFATPTPSSTPLPTPVPVPAATPTTEQLSKWNQFKAAVDQIAPMFNFPKNVILAQAALESAHGTSDFAVYRNNFLGINALDWNPNLSYSFESPQECVFEYIRIIKHNFPEAYAARSNPEQMLYLLKHNKRGVVYATDPNYISKVTAQNEWKGGN